MPTSKTPKSPTKDGRLLSKKAYKTLLDGIVTLIDSADATGAEAKIESTWSIGRRISAAHLSQKAGYHNSVIHDLAEDTGVSARVLQEAVAFHRAYKAPPAGTGLNWSHYRQLMRLPERERTAVEKKAIAQSWSARDLAAALIDLQADPDDTKGPLKRPTDPTYLYRATVTKVVDGDTLDVDIDLGFEVTRHSRLRLALIDTPDIKTAKGRAARDFLLQALLGAKTVALTTQRIDLHGRYVAHLFTSPTDVPTLACFQSGKYINQALLVAHLAAFRPRG